jgi:NAD-dependent SIR2 family protein deacetylase
MPLYQWRCEQCGQQEDTVETVEERDKPPAIPETDGCEHQWIRLVGAPKTVRGPSWNGSKGNWIWLLCFLNGAVSFWQINF